MVAVKIGLHTEMTCTLVAARLNSLYIYVICLRYNIVQYIAYILTSYFLLFSHLVYVCLVIFYCSFMLLSKWYIILSSCGSDVEHCVSSAKCCGFNSQETHILTKIYSLNWLKATVKSINVIVLKIPLGGSLQQATLITVKQNITNKSFCTSRTKWSLWVCRLVCLEMIWDKHIVI